MAHKKGAGSSRNGRESHSKRLGIKIFGGQAAIAGNIIVRQRGTPHHPDKNVGIGKDHTLFALIDGTVVFKKKADNKSYVSVLPREIVAAEVAAPIKEKKVTVSASEVIEAPIAEKKAVKSEKPIVAEAAAQPAKEEVAEPETEASKTKEPVAAKEPAKKEEVKKDKVAEPKTEVDKSEELNEEPVVPAKKSAQKDVDAIAPLAELTNRTKAQTPSEEL